MSDFYVKSVHLSLLQEILKHLGARVHHFGCVYTVLAELSLYQYVINYN